jgi:hypothetical protein
MAKGFDLNIEKVLENWEVSHALREIIANALDEQLLTNTEKIRISKNENTWVIRDYGRGLQPMHLTQNENEEKLRSSNVIGKFGVGLKDALATFDRHDIGVTIQSKYNTFTFNAMKKSGFEDIITLHAIVDNPTDDEFVGTEFRIDNCPDEDMKKAKQMFLQFSDSTLLENTKIGDVYEKIGHVSKIYLNGVLVAEEDNFMFSYNITSLNAQIKKALNRERTNVSRTAYTPRIKEILLKCTGNVVADELCSNLDAYNSGEMSEEVRWTDVALHAAKIRNAHGDAVYMTASMMQNMSGREKEIIDDSGKKYIIVPDNIYEKLQYETDYSGSNISTVKTVINEYNDSYEYKFVPVNELSSDELEVYKTLDWILSFMNAKGYKTKIEISETLRPGSDMNDLNPVGVWDSSLHKIIIKRDQLKSKKDFMGTLIHELIHAITGCADVSRDFEIHLTNTIGKLAYDLEKSTSEAYGPNVTTRTDNNQSNVNPIEPKQKRRFWG